MFILSKTIFRFSEIPIKIPIAFFHRNKTNNPKICIEPQRTLSSSGVFKSSPGDPMFNQNREPLSLFKARMGPLPLAYQALIKLTDEIQNTVSPLYTRVPKP